MFWIVIFPAPSAFANDAEIPIWSVELAVEYDASWIGKTPHVTREPELGLVPVIG